MIKEVLKINSMEELLSKNNFEFIDSLERNIDEIHQKIAEQKNKRKQAIVILKVLNIPNALNDSEINILSNTNDILNIINSNIASLYSIEVDLNKICQNFTDSYVPNLSKSNSDSIFDSIKSSVNLYSDELSNFNVIFDENNEKIDNFLRANANLINSAVYKKSDKSETSSLSNSILGNSFVDNEVHIDNPYLIVSEKNKKVYLPYKVSEVYSYIEKYPNSYSSFKDVVKKEFTISLDYFTKRPAYTRFKESYNLIRDREGKSILEALKYSFNLMFKDNLNPAIIAACKTQEQLDDYLTCLEHNNLTAFKHFEIQFNVNPL